MRRAYDRAGLSESDLAGTWLAQFTGWFAEAVDSGLLVEPNAMVLATATLDGLPSGRTVLLKGYDEAGLVFFTNYESRKGRELAVNPFAALVFPWYPLHRQVIVTGRVSRVSRAETEAYFASRPFDSKIGAWASPQSQVLPSRAPLEQAFGDLVAGWLEDGAEIPAPDHWGGLRVAPDTVEFWQGRSSRLHDRLRYRRIPDADWVIERLAP
ncbi:MAG TPA: pyridoxamine 5'-phosphate oxidase [Mycobacteriales bacterium]|jgi:pyridoxamine 5'-phosphate oxidase|nr:pyridoxamine 5'-phosphate oxidase [Mycobacteriales bacterium]